MGACLYAGGGFAQSFIGAVQWLRVSCVARYSGLRDASRQVPVSDAFTQVLFDFRNVPPGTSIAMILAKSVQGTLNGIQRSNISRLCALRFNQRHCSRGMRSTMLLLREHH